MDNLSAHKGERVRNLIEERGCELLYLPPYSPDLNPIEEALSKAKGSLLETAVRTHEAWWRQLEGRSQLLRALRLPCVGSTTVRCAALAYPTVPSTLPRSTEGKDNSRIVMVAVVFVHRADLPESVKTRPWRLRTDRLPKLPEEPQLLLITEHQLTS